MKVEQQLVDAIAREAAADLDWAWIMTRWVWRDVPWWRRWGGAERGGRTMSKPTEMSSTITAEGVR
jgi:hypothetical protein